MDSGTITNGAENGTGNGTGSENLTKKLSEISSKEEKQELEDKLRKLEDEFRAFRAQRNLYLQDKASINTIPPTLKSYSRQGSRYVKKVQYMIRHFDLKRYD